MKRAAAFLFGMRRRPPRASRRKKRCGGARAIWRKRRGSRVRGVGLGEWREETPCISPRNGIAYMASTQKKARRLGKKRHSAFIRRIEKSGSGQSIEQSVKNRITKWKCESFFRTVLSNTSTPSAILF